MDPKTFSEHARKRALLIRDQYAQCVPQDGQSKFAVRLAVGVEVHDLSHPDGEKLAAELDAAIRAVLAPHIQAHNDAVKAGLG